MPSSKLIFCLALILALAVSWTCAAPAQKFTLKDFELEEDQILVADPIVDDEEARLPSTSSTFDIDFPEYLTHSSTLMASPSPTPSSVSIFPDSNSSPEISISLCPMRALTAANFVSSTKEAFELGGPRSIWRVASWNGDSYNGACLGLHLGDGPMGGSVNVVDCSSPFPALCQGLESSAHPISPPPKTTLDQVQTYFEQDTSTSFPSPTFVRSSPTPEPHVMGYEEEDSTFFLNQKENEEKDLQGPTSGMESQNSSAYLDSFSPDHSFESTTKSMDGSELSERIEESEESEEDMTHTYPVNFSQVTSTFTPLSSTVFPSPMPSSHCNQLRALTSSNFAASVQEAFQIGGARSIWRIASWNGDSYNGVCLGLYLGDNSTGGSVNVISCQDQFPSLYESCSSTPTFPSSPSSQKTFIPAPWSNTDGDEEDEGEFEIGNENDTSQNFSEEQEEGEILMM